MSCKYRKLEFIVYAVIWLLLVLLPFINEFMGMKHGFPFSWADISYWLLGMVPFVLVFLINKFFLAPRLLIRIKGAYPLAAVLMIALFVFFQEITCEWRHDLISGAGLHAPVSPLVNLFLVLILLALDLAITFIFKYVRENEERKSLENIRLQDEIRFLKTQINPHFFMNMLNNIHAMIDLDQAKAQDMTIELSKMMRHVLYEGDSQRASLADEMGFLSSYVSLLRVRYPESKVKIDLNLPQEPSKHFYLPPIIFLSFVENAFKHGVSYRNLPYIGISVVHDGDFVNFVCKNTKQNKDEDGGKADGGVGLENVRRRLDLHYGEGYSLSMAEDEGYYVVNLSIPSL